MNRQDKINTIIRSGIFAGETADAFKDFSNAIINVLYESACDWMHDSECPSDLCGTSCKGCPEYRTPLFCDTPRCTANPEFPLPCEPVCAAIAYGECDYNCEQCMFKQ